MRKFLFIFFILSLVSFSHADFTKKDAGTRGLQFLKIGIGARALGMGEAYTAVSDDVNSIYWNAAGLAYLESQEASLMHYVWFEDITYQSLLYAYPMYELGTLGVMINYLNIGDIDRTDSSGNINGKFSANDMAVTVSYAKEIFSRLALGGNIKYVQSSIDDKVAKGVVFDAGVKANLMEDKLDFGASVQNLGDSVKYVSEETELPVVIRTGIAYKKDIVGIKFDTGYLLAFDIYAPIDNEIGANLGGEYNIFLSDDLDLSVRAGYKTHQSDIEGLKGVTLGFGCEYKTWNIDYAWTPYGEIGITHQISLLFKFNTIIQD